MTRKLGVLVVIIAAVAMVATFAACSKKGGGLVANWPVANAERKTPKPPEPILWPLTGLEAPSADAVRQRVISVKIENSPTARPQSGIQAADVVYESVAEGGITRFNVLFHSTAPDPVGPVRSARLSDTTIVPQYGALFVFSGASSSVNAAVREAGLPNLSEDAGVTYPFFRSNERPRPHNLYAHLDKVREEAVRRKMSATQDPKPLAFDTRVASVPATPTVVEIDIPFSTSNRVLWKYDAETNSYLRWNNGKVHSDALTGKQVRTRNVVVMWARYVPASNRDTTGSTTYDIELTGTGRVSVFRDGQRYDGTWQATNAAPPVFKTAEGVEIKLAPGNTWFQVVNTSVNIKMK